MKQYNLPSFNADKLNQRIENIHKIKYKELSLDSSAAEKSLTHIRERHIDHIVQLYCQYKNSQSNLLNYANLLEIREDLFHSYHQNLVDVSNKLSDLEKGASSYFIEQIHNKIYDPHAIHSLSQIINTKDIEYLCNKLTIARQVPLSETDFDKINGSIICLLDKTVSEPSKIFLVNLEDKHIYVSNFKYKNKNLIVVVGCHNGRVITAYIRKQLTPAKSFRKQPQSREYQQIYPK